jgi:multimeric flavodoxin WrbA
MKIVAICGSPRKGNTEFMLRTLLDSAKKAGADADLILLKDKNIKLCDGCHICGGNSGKCSIQDDMDQIRKDVVAADVIVFGSPQYYDAISGRLKNFIDRLNPCAGDLKGKKFAFVIAGQLKDSDGEESRKYVSGYLKHLSELYGMKFIGFEYGICRNPGEICKDNDCIDRLNKLGKKLA